MRVLLADDHPTVLAGLEALLRPVPLLQVVGTAANSDALLHLLERTACDVLVTDYAMPGGALPDGLAMLGFLRRRFPHLAIVLHTMQESPAVLGQVLRLGIGRIVSKADASGHLAVAVQAARAGGDYLSPAIQALLAGSVQGPALTPREEEVVRLYVAGLGTTQIAAQLHRSKQTISTQKRSAMRKLGVAHAPALVSAWEARQRALRSR